MAQQNDSLLTTEANVIQNETASGQNTALRVGTMLNNIIDSKINNDKIAQSITTSSTTVPSAAAVKAYADSLVTGLLDDRGNFDASGVGSPYPSTGGSGTAGAILKGDIWFIDVAGTVGTTPVGVGASVRALDDSPGQTSSKWDVLDNGAGITPEDVNNKSDDTTLGGVSPSSILYPTQNAVKTYVDGTFEPLIGYTTENVANKATSQAEFEANAGSSVMYPSIVAVKDYIDSNVPPLTLEQVLTNGHTLTGERNFQGTNAGSSSTGTNINAFGIGAAANSGTFSNINALGYYAAVNNAGDNVNAIGYSSVTGNTGTYVTGIGTYVCQNNKGSSVDAIGTNAAAQNTGNNVIAIGGSSSQANTGTYVIGIGENASLGNTGTYVTGLGYSAASGNSGSKVNGIGLNAASGNISNHVNAFGESAAISNSGSNLNAMGKNSANGNSGVNLNAIGELSASANTGFNVNAFGYQSAINNTGSNVNSIGSAACVNNSGANVNAFGNQAGYNNTYNSVNLFGASAVASADNQLGWSNQNAYTAQLSNTNITANRKYELQDKSGTLALEDYLVYTALLQFNGGSPTATVLKNTLGTTLNWSFPLNGILRGTAASGSPFTTSKTWITSGAYNNGGQPHMVTSQRANLSPTTMVDFYFFLYDGTLNMPNVTNFSIEIRVYP